MDFLRQAATVRVEIAPEAVNSAIDDSSLSAPMNDEISATESYESHTSHATYDYGFPHSQYFRNVGAKLQTGVDHANESFANLLSSLYNRDDESRDLLSPLPLNRNKVASLRYPEISWMLKNPYSSVRGRHHSPQSFSAVRSLLSLLPVEHEPRDIDNSSRGGESLETLGESIEESRRVAKIPRSTRSETASQLAEGTIRALRDLELQEAIELHRSLRFWTTRWERPVLSWLEAGPSGKSFRRVSYDTFLIDVLLYLNFASSVAVRGGIQPPISGAESIPCPSCTS